MSEWFKGKNLSHWMFFALKKMFVADRKFHGTGLMNSRLKAVMLSPVQPMAWSFTWLLPSWREYPMPYLFGAEYFIACIIYDRRLARWKWYYCHAGLLKLGFPKTNPQHHKNQISLPKVFLHLYFSPFHNVTLPVHTKLVDRILVLSLCLLLLLFFLGNLVFD